MDDLQAQYEQDREDERLLAAEGRLADEGGPDVLPLGPHLLAVGAAP